MIKRYPKQHPDSPPRPTEQALNQSIRGFETATSSTTILVSENQKLFAETSAKRQKSKMEDIYCEGKCFIQKQKDYL
jgi:hypothetical protein